MRALRVLPIGTPLFCCSQGGMGEMYVWNKAQAVSVCECVDRQLWQWCAVRFFHPVRELPWLLLLICCHGDAPQSSS